MSIPPDSPTEPVVGCFACDDSEAHSGEIVVRPPARSKGGSRFPCVLSKPVWAPPVNQSVRTSALHRRYNSALEVIITEAIPLDAIRRMREVMRVRANEALEDNGVLFCFPTSITGRKRDVDGVLL